MRQFKCDICGLTIKSKAANLRRHKLLHGPKVNKLKCCCCQETFSTQFNFEIHCKRAHTKEKIIAGVWVKENAKQLRPVYGSDSIKTENLETKLPLQTKDAPISLQSVTKPEVLNGMTLNQKQPSQKTMNLIPPEISLELAQLETRKIQYLSDDAASETSIKSNGLVIDE